MRVFVAVLLSLAAVANGNLFQRLVPERPLPMIKNGVDPGKPLFLTPLIESGQFEKARMLSKTQMPIDVEGYSGFMTVNKQHNSNMFFWFFPSQTDPKAPVLLWLQGGPGGSSLFGLFVENGPLMVDKNGKMSHRKITWNTDFSMLYIDNPVGTGFSFTGDDAGYVTNEDEVARDLYSCLTQFFLVFPDFQKNDFYVTGESYAGKYVPAISYKIHTENPKAKVKINFKGMAIGDGLCDPVTMMPAYADFMFSIGLLDEKQRDHFRGVINLLVASINEGKYIQAFDRFNDAFDFMESVSGTQDYYNFIRSVNPPEFNYFNEFLAKPEVRKAIHVGSLPYSSLSDVVYQHLIKDFMQSVKPKIATILDNYKVMIYNGQLDIIVAVPLSEAWLQTVQWSGLAAYKNASRMIWKVKQSDKEVAGYVRQVKGLFQVIVRDAGHILPFDQPRRALDMIRRFVRFENVKK